MRGASTRRGLATSAAALMVSSALGSVIGLVFWAAATRLFPAAVVGRAAAVVSAAILIGTLAQLNIGALYVRFLTVSGRRAVRFVAVGYAVTGGLSFVAAVAFAWSGAADRYLPASPVSRLIFAGLTTFTMLLTVQDAILTALRRATTVMVTNLTVAASKLALVLAVGVFAIRTDLIVVWLLPTAAVVVVISWRMFRAWLPALRDVPDEGLFPTPRAIASFAGAEYLNRLLSMLPSSVVPLIVVQVLGAGDNAYFTVPWTINAAVGAVIYATAAAFVAEGVAARGLSWHSLRLMLGINAALAVLGLLGEFLAARLLLGLLGADYAARGESLLHWLALTVPFQASTGVCIVFIWLEGRVWWNTLMLVVENSVFLSLGWVLMRSHGLDGIGQAYLVGQVLITAGVAYPVLSRVIRARRTGRHAVGVVGAPARVSGPPDGGPPGGADRAGDPLVVAGAPRTVGSCEAGQVTTADPPGTLTGDDVRGR